MEMQARAVLYSLMRNQFSWQPMKLSHFIKA